jgi:hypothetical protein
MHMVERRGGVLYARSMASSSGVARRSGLAVGCGFSGSANCSP